MISITVVILLISSYLYEYWNYNISYHFENDSFTKRRESSFHVPQNKKG